MSRYLTIEDGREYLWDFDENRILLVTYGDTENIRQVEFSTDDTEGPTTWTSEVMTNLTTGNKYVQAPNEFLNGEYSRLVCYVIAEDETGQHTRTKEIFRIKKRQQPEDYEITFTDRVYIRDLKAIAERYRDQAKEYSEQAAASSTQAGQYNAQALESKNAASLSAQQASESMESAQSAQHAAESARNDANAILTLVQSKGTEITNFVATSKTEIETQKNESVNAVKSVYQTDLNELKSDLNEEIKKSATINKWNETWELGNLSWNEGLNIDSTNTIRSKGFIVVEPNTSYYMVGKAIVYCYDENKQFVGVDGRFNLTGSGGVFTTTSTTRYVRFRTDTSYGTTYKNDMGINYPSTYHSYISSKVADSLINLEQNQINYVSLPQIVSPRTSKDSELKIEKVGESIKLTLPTSQKQLNYIYNGVWYTFNYTDTEITIPNYNALIFDFSTRNLKVLNVNQSGERPLENYPNRYYILLLNDNGYPKGEWAKYYNYSLLEEEIKYVETDNGFVRNYNTNITILSRQNQFTGVPENSLVGLKKCALAKYKGVRVSVRFTSDNVPVLSHNDDISHLARNIDGSTIESGTVLVSNSTYSELLNYDFGIIYGSTYAGTKICKLEDYLLNAKCFGMYIMIETKDVLTDEQANILNRLFNKTGMVGNVGVFEGGAGRTANLEKLHALNPNIDLGYLPYQNTYWNTTNVINFCKTIKGNKNKVFIVFNVFSGPSEIIVPYVETIMQDNTFIDLANKEDILLYMSGVNSVDDIMPNLKYGATWIECWNIDNPEKEIFKNAYLN